LCFHTNGVHYHHGVLEPADDVRSVPLGAKRRKGRPKNLPNCLANSPISARLPSAEPAAVVDDEAPLRKTTRKRKRMEVEPDADHVVHPSDPPLAPDADHDDHPSELPLSPVHALLRQRAGLGAPKPPKKIRRQAPVAPSSSHQSRQAPAPAAAFSAESPAGSLPPAINCKKKKDTCIHKVVFGKHYNKNLWEKYAMIVKSKKSTVEIDPNYVA
jgi:hypothetical protein